MGTRKIIIILALVLVVFLATIFMFVYKTFSPSNRPSRDRWENTPGTSTPIKKATSTPINNTGVPKDIDINVPISECTTFKKAEAQGKEYEKGSLLVTFLSGVSYRVAVDTIDALKLKADTSAQARENFELYHWLPVTVPRGEEFKWQCLLDASEGIKKANLNLTFNLRQ